MHLDFEQLKYILSVLGRCTDDYLFILDFPLDHVVISDRAVEVFRLSEAQFYHATEVLKDAVYEEDFPGLVEDLLSLKEGRRETHNMEYRWVSKYGMPIWISCRGEVIKDGDGNARYLVGRIAELGRKNKIDANTGLYNEAIMKKHYCSLKEQQDISGYMMLIGIDNYKEINEKYGHEFGDSILSNLADVIRDSVGPEEGIYRMEGDNIIVFNHSDGQADDAKKLYYKIRTRLEETITENGYKMFHTISAGVIHYHSDKTTFEQVTDKVAFALHSAKRKGKNTVVVYDKDEYDQYIRKLNIQESLKKSIENGFEGFELYYQPIVDAQNHCLHGAEALIRWSSEEYGFLSPVEFIPLLEESSLIIPLGRWIMKTAVDQCLKWQKIMPDFQMNVNLSFVQIQRSNIIQDVTNCLRNVGIDAGKIVFEVTESGQIETSQTTQNVLKKFTERSLRLAIDDFGTGYSNLRYMKEKMFDVVKIDRIFIQNILTTEYDYTLVKYVTELAHSMNMKVCYEGIETKEQLDAAQKLHPDYIQGYYYSKPVTAREFEEKMMGDRSF